MFRRLVYAEVRDAKGRRHVFGAREGKGTEQEGRSTKKKRVVRLTADSTPGDWNRINKRAAIRETVLLDFPASILMRSHEFYASVSSVRVVKRRP